MKKQSDNSTSWQKSSQWYKKSVGEKGHYYHQSIIMPNSLRLLNIQNDPKSSLLDLACGQGVLGRHIPSQVQYFGVDIAHSLIDAARQYKPPKNHEFIVADASKELPIKKNDFTHAAIILALQNIESPLNVFKNAYKHLTSNGKFLLVLNHPCFRIPRQSSWQIDSNSKIQYRRIDSYMSPLRIPIQTHPSQGKQSPQTWSFHFPLSTYCQWLNEAGFNILSIEEWCSDKESEGKTAKMENKSRQEIPLFMAIINEKK
jgi:ubiquinone/menaquinone biosynthesis C-methylase UbiE